MKIERIDHLNLTVADIDRSVEFYRRVLGMKAERIGEGRAALYFGQQKIHLDAAGGKMEMGGEKRMPAHICFITEVPMGEVTAHLESCGVPVRMQGPRAGAIVSFNMTEPDIAVVATPPERAAAPDDAGEPAGGAASRWPRIAAWVSRSHAAKPPAASASPSPPMGRS